MILKLNFRRILEEWRGFTRSIKRIASAVGEGSMTGQFVHKYSKNTPDEQPRRHGVMAAVA